MPTTKQTQLINPFVGLRAFEEAEDYLFFGRSQQIGELLKVLSESRFLAVIGSSGSGKSSLVKSGLLPAIYSGFMTVGSNWRAVTMRPGEDPIGYLTKALAGVGVLYDSADEGDVPREGVIESSLRRSENGLTQVYKEARLPAHEQLLIVVDQFEELFRFSRYEKENRLGKSDAIHFIQLLLAAIRQKECPVYVLLTMRADFLGDCAEFRGLPEAINEGQYLIPRMRRDEIREAITGPVAVSSATISQRLVTRLLNDLNNDTDQLPILQHALMRTWDAWYRRNQHNTPIDFEDYEAIGTMRSALSLHADEAFADLAPKDQHICELMFKALTDKAADIRGIRRPRSIADLSVLTNGSEERVKQVVEVFRRPGRTFLMPPPAVPLTEHAIVDISHESLMRIWTRLAVWIEEEARSGDIYLRLANSAQLHEQGQRGLLKNPELEIALRWREKNRPIAKWAEGYKASFEQAMIYLDKSQEEDLEEKRIIADKERTRKRLVRSVFLLLSGLVIAGVVIAVILNGLRKEAIEEKRKAEAAKAEAQQQKDEATRQKLNADTARTRAERAFEQAHEADSISQVLLAKAIESRKFAEVKQTEATLSAALARERTIEVQNERVKVENLFTKTRNQNLKIAANEYARLIREGPSEENNNRDEFYGRNYLLIYADHFNHLENRVAEEDKNAYRFLKEKLYFNNDLYRRLYENLVIAREKDAVIKKENGVIPAAFQLSADPDANGLSVVKSDNGLRNSIALSNGGQRLSFTLPKRGQEFTALAAGPANRVVLGATTDHLIYAFDSKLHVLDVINMGARVTALDYSSVDNKDLIYFGTASGYIGYIRFNSQKKNQPVFENKLETEITAIQLFRHPGGDGTGKENSFLLAAGLGSSPRVYKLDVNSLRPDKLLLGNELPYTRKEYGDIQRARYVPRLNRVILATTTGYYSWNPFTEDLLQTLKTKLRPDPSLVTELQYY